MITGCPVCRRRGMTSRIIREWGYRSYSMLSGKLGTSGRLVSVTGCWGRGNSALWAVFGETAGDVEIALRGEHLVGGR